MKQQKLFAIGPNFDAHTRAQETAVDVHDEVKEPLSDESSETGSKSKWPGHVYQLQVVCYQHGIIHTHVWWRGCTVVYTLCILCTTQQSVYVYLMTPTGMTKVDLTEI